MSSKSATLLVVFVIAVGAFCIASVFAAMTGEINILPNETDLLNSSDNSTDDVSVSDSSADDSGNDYSYSSSSGSGSASSQSQDSGYNHDSPSTPEHNPDGGTHDDSSGGASGTEEGDAGRTP